MAGLGQHAAAGEPRQLPSAVLPLDSVIEILTRLPVKSLIRFKCVSKSFETLISSSEFVKHHLRRRRRLQSSDDGSNPLILIPSTSKTGYRSISVESLYESENENHPPHPQPNNFNFNSNFNFTDLDHSPFSNEAEMKPCWVVGSCDGLICVATKRRLLSLWNPSTRAFSTLPEFDVPKKQGRRCYMVLGFGYDSLSGDYKVVSISCYPNKQAGGESHGIVQVCSLSNSRVWRRIEDFQYGLPSDYPGKHVKGTLNWLMDNESSSIVSLDLHEETYRQVVEPELEDLEEGVQVQVQKTIGVLEDCLCVMYHRHDHYSELWVMKELGVEESWTKLFRVEVGGGDGGLRSLQYSMPIHASKGRTLLWLWSFLVVYNSHNGGSVIYPLPDDVWCCQLYIETLVSPHLND